MVGGKEVCADAVDGAADDPVVAVIANQAVCARIAVAAAKNCIHDRGCIYNKIVVIVWGIVVWLGGSGGYNCCWCCCLWYCCHCGRDCRCARY